jgi:hypothetical protein
MFCLQNKTVYSTAAETTDEITGRKDYKLEFEAAQL